MPASSRIVVSTGAFLLLYGVIALSTLSLSERSAAWLACTAILALTLATLSAIDAATFRLPDIFTLLLAAGGLALPWLVGDGISLVERVLAGAGAFILLAGIDSIYRRLRGRSGLGLGDAKLFAAAGSWLGAEPLSLALLWATGSALAAVSVAAIRGDALTRETRIAFGPFLAFGFWMAWIGAA